jgi:large-conductance mechanosensitive channel
MLNNSKTIVRQLNQNFLLSLISKSNVIKLANGGNHFSTVNLAYELSDKFNSNKALVIAHGLFGSKVLQFLIALSVLFIILSKIKNQSKSLTGKLCPEE